jgi:hypothetical protein
VGSKFLFYRHLPIKISLSIIMTRKRWYRKFNLSIRVVRSTIVITLLAVWHTFYVLMKMAMEAQISGGRFIIITFFIKHRIIGKMWTRRWWWRCFLLRLQHSKSVDDLGQSLIQPLISLAKIHVNEGIMHWLMDRLLHLLHQQLVVCLKILAANTLIEVCRDPCFFFITCHRNTKIGNKRWRLSLIISLHAPLMWNTGTRFNVSYQALTSV